MSKMEHNTGRRYCTGHTWTWHKKTTQSGSYRKLVAHSTGILEEGLIKGLMLVWELVWGMGKQSGAEPTLVAQGQEDKGISNTWRELRSAADRDLRRGSWEVSHSPPVPVTLPDLPFGWTHLETGRQGSQLIFWGCNAIEKGRKRIWMGRWSWSTISSPSMGSWMKKSQPSPG